MTAMHPQHAELPSGQADAGTPAVETSCDALLGGRVTIVQPRRGARVAVDSLLLAAALDANPGARALELGAGVGAVSLCAAVRLESVGFLGLEREEALVRLAQENAARNRLEDRCRFVSGAVAEPPPAVASAAPFDLVFFNPPYLAADRADAPPDALRRRAFVEEDGLLADWIRTAHRLLASRGWLVLIHRADRLDEILALLRPRRHFGEIAVLPIHTRSRKPARRVIVRARKNGRGACTLLPALRLHEDDGAFTVEAERILRAGAPLPGWRRGR